MSSAVSLEYAPGAPIRRRKRIRRVVIFLLLASACLGGWRWGPGACKQGVLLYWQRQCTKYEVRADAPFYEPDPAKAAALLAQPDTDYVPMAFYQNNVGLLTQAVFYPRCLREFEIRASTTYRPKDCAIVYLHERRTPAGKRRLVVIYAWPWGGAGAMWEWAVYEPAGTFGATLLNHGLDEVGMRTGMMTGFSVPKQLGPGQSDPADETHFTIPCIVNGQRIGAYDGRLTDEDKIVMTRK